MTCACAGRFGGGLGSVPACGTGAACVLHNIAEDKRISERILFLIVGCIATFMAYGVLQDELRSQQEKAAPRPQLWHVIALSKIWVAVERANPSSHFRISQFNHYWWEGNSQQETVIALYEIQLARF